MRRSRRPAFRYHGGKYRLADWIIQKLPPHRVYVEPFGGAGSVLLAKPRSAMEVLNDADGEVVTFFKVLREQPESLVRALSLTPYARAEVQQAVRLDPDLPELERARRFYVGQQMRVSPALSGESKSLRFRREVLHASDNVATAFYDLSPLLVVAERLRGVVIENDDWEAVVRRYDGPETCHYLDPPYLLATRRRPDHGYRHELSAAGHAHLCAVARELTGSVLISGYEAAAYHAGLPGFFCLRRPGWSSGPGQKTEVLWVRSRTGRQLSLEAGWADPVRTA